MKKLKILLLLMCVSVATLKASMAYNGRAVVFKCCQKRTSTQGRHHRSLASPIYGFLDGRKLSLENCRGGYVYVVANGIVCYEAVVPDGLEIELPSDIVGSFDVFVMYKESVYKAVLAI